MRKMVVLTEGQTEQIFVTEILLHLASQRSLHIDCKRLNGGRKFATVEIAVSTFKSELEDPQYYILILDCSSDGRVVSSLLERYRSFVEQDYKEIILLRDVAPDFEYDQREKLYNRISAEMPTSQPQPVVVLATMEIEAWFVAEISHFSRVNHSLDAQRLVTFGLDASTDIEPIIAPAKLLADIYASAGVSYGKSKNDVERTIAALDKQQYGALSGKIPAIIPLLEAISRFFSSTTTPAILISSPASTCP